MNVFFSALFVFVLIFACNHTQQKSTQSVATESHSEIQLMDASLYSNNDAEPEKGVRFKKQIKSILYITKNEKADDSQTNHDFTKTVVSQHFQNWGSLGYWKGSTGILSPD